MLDIDQFLLLSKLADTTQSLYRHYLEIWQGYLVDQCIHPKKARPLDVAAWIGMHTAWSDSTRHSAVASVRAYYRWKFGARHPVLSFNVARRPTAPQRTPRIAQVEKLLSSLDTRTPRGRMLLAMVTLMLDTGLRAAEICRLEVDRVDVEAGLLYVRVKGGAWQPKRFFAYTRSCLAAWLADRKAAARTECKTVFVVLKGPRKGLDMGRYTLKTIFRRLGQSSGIGAFSAHDLRRAFATFAIANGAPTRLVQEAGGWENIEMVERYTRAISLEAMRDYSPVDRLMGIPPGKD